MTAFSRHKVLESWLIACLVLGKQKYTRTVQVSGSPCVWTPPLGVTLTIIYIYHFVMLFPSTQLVVYGVHVEDMFSDKGISNILNEMMFVLFILYVVCMFIVAYYCYCCIVYMFILLLITDVVYYYHRSCCLYVKKKREIC